MAKKNERNLLSIHCLYKVYMHTKLFQVLKVSKVLVVKDFSISLCYYTNISILWRIKSILSYLQYCPIKRVLSPQSIVSLFGCPFVAILWHHNNFFNTTVCETELAQMNLTLRIKLTSSPGEFLARTVVWSN